jgi:type IV pilus assembly protein PilA
VRSDRKLPHSSDLLQDLNLQSSNSGFTLVELMVVVAMVGVLSAIAVNNFKKMVGRARQAEAKIELAATYTAQRAFFTEKGSYTYCLFRTGYEPTTGTNRYYTVGYLHGGLATVCGPYGNDSCYKYEWNGSVPDCDCNPAGWAWGGGIRNDCTFWQTASVNPSAWSTFGTGPTLQVTQNTFLTGAMGSISDLGTLDYWTINENKLLKNTQSGL